MLNFFTFILQVIGFLIIVPICLWVFSLLSVLLSFIIAIFGIRGAFEEWKEKHK